MISELYRWWVRDGAGVLRLTGVLMTREEALERFPEAKPEPSTRLQVPVSPAGQPGSSSR